MRIAICDDNIEYIKTIEEYLKKIKIPKIEYDVFQSGEEIVFEYKNNEANYDAIFLDMEMGKLDGIETANLIRQIDRYVIIVFVTSYKKYMQRCFECMPFRFLIKPIEFSDFYKVYNEICIKLKDKPETLIFNERRDRIRIYIEDIIFFESTAHWIIVHSKDGRVHKIRKTMSDLINILDGSMFVRIHRSIVINLNYIYQITESNVAMHNYSELLPISRTYKKVLTDSFLDFKERKYLL